MNERHYNGWGDPCPTCQDQHQRDPAWHVQRATHHGMCSRHWLGATEAQRRAALFDEATQDGPVILDADDALRAWAA